MDPEPAASRCRREGAGMKGGVPSPGGSCARPLRRPPGLALRAGRAAGTGWGVQRRLNLQEDILIRSRLPQPSAAAGGRTGLLPAPLPRGPGGARNRDGGSRNWSPAPGGRAGPSPLRAPLPLAKVNQSLPRPGGARRVRWAAAGGGPEGGVRAGPPQGGVEPASAEASGPGPVRCSETPGRRRRGAGMMGWGCWGLSLGPRLRGQTHPGGNGD